MQNVVPGSGDITLDYRTIAKLWHTVLLLCSQVHKDILQQGRCTFFLPALLKHAATTAVQGASASFWSGGKSSDDAGQ